MNGPELVDLLTSALPQLISSRDELQALDAAVGDGDLGVTVSKGCEAVLAALSELDDPSPSGVLAASGKAFATANPSTMAALAGGGLLAAAKAVADIADLDRAAATTVLAAVTDRIVQRGKAEPGDKTVLDALVPSLHALQASTAAGAGTVTEMALAAGRAVDETTALVGQRGRAAWVGERGAGHPDPGATAYWRLLEALAGSWPSG
jgi:dihydroxyacetone kinase-like protein